MSNKMSGLLRQFDELGKLMDGESGERVMEAAGKRIQAAARDNVRANLNKNATGKLESEIVVNVVTSRSVEVGVREGRIPYANIHEFGGVISAKSAKRLAFYTGGKSVFAKSVVIPARPYLRPAVDAERNATRTAAGNAVDKEIKAIAK
jgi:HK97 gp10 family phage protein